MEDHVRAIRDELDAIASITDHEERARAATGVLQLLTEANGELARMRREDVRAMLAAGLTYRRIGAAIGVHWTRVKHIESGQPTGNSSRARAAKAQARADAPGGKGDSAGEDQEG
jgi:hypothetical protein